MANSKTGAAAAAPKAGRAKTHLSSRPGAGTGKNGQRSKSPRREDISRSVGRDLLIAMGAEPAELEALTPEAEAALWYELARVAEEINRKLENIHNDMQDIIRDMRAMRGVKTT